MTKRRLSEDLSLSATDLDPKNWPQVLLENIPEKDRKTFERRQKAVDMYCLGQPLAEIRKATGLSENEITRLYKRCVKTDQFGRTAGYTALVPRKRITKYARKQLHQRGQRIGAGAFEQLLETYPELRDLIETLYLDRKKRRVREHVMSIKKIHEKFLKLCRDLRITNEYPFTTNDSALRSLTRYCRKLDSLFFTEAAGRNGTQAKQNAKLLSFGPPNSSITRPLERVQFDGHRIDAFLSIRLRTPEGDYVIRPLNRIWLLTIIDVATSGIVGYYLSLNQEYTGADVLRCIRNAICPHQKIKFTIPGLKYPTFTIDDVEIEGGFPSDFFMEMRWATFDELCLDNGKANLSNVVLERVTNSLKCSLGLGPVGTPTRRGLIERFFGVLEEMGYHRLISTTGSNPKDPRRNGAEKAAMKYEITFEDLQQVTEILIAQYNLSPHSKVNYLSPIEAMRQRILERGMLPRMLDEQEQGEVELLLTTVKRKVQGSVKTGRRPHINYMGGEYRSQLLDQSTFLIGQEVTLQVNLDDLRVVKAYLRDGSEFGNLVVQGKWSLHAHNWELRSTIIRLKNKGLLKFGVFDDPIEIYHQYLEETVNDQKISRNRLIQLKQQEEAERNNEQQISSIPSPIAPQQSEILQISKTEKRRERGKRERLFKRTLNY